MAKVDPRTIETLREPVDHGATPPALAQNLIRIAATDDKLREGTDPHVAVRQTIDDLKLIIERLNIENKNKEKDENPTL